MKIDEADAKIIEGLIKDARMSLKDLSILSGLSSPGVSERIRRLQERGVISGFSAEIDPRALGYSLQAIVRIRPLPGKLHIVQQLIQDIPEFIECDKVTGDDCFIARLAIPDIEKLDGILDKVSDKAETSTSIVKSQPIRRRPPPLTVESR
ncbi:Lrp/AsnC family transcriptional regulator [Roseibium aggregatum]|uniref:Lrp/AsnC family transcriptional regulator n=1 Tax=Roseibium aggregatum TaxID=187304 RepID=A0A939J253_9HYPH|nr:Lrp/AsnC family transcriptional regulator [Roseibium aggregatum]MBN9671053.1 Lrp/AsnC family transcriptional regulator [Roseibium aggregatum]